MFSGVRCPLNEAGPSASTKNVARPASALPSISRPSQVYSSLTIPRPATVAASHGLPPEHEISHFSNESGSITTLHNNESVFEDHRLPDISSSRILGAGGALSDHNSMAYKNPRQDDDIVHRYDKPENSRSNRTAPSDFDCPSSSAPGRLTKSDQDLSYATSSQQRRLENIIYQPQPSSAPIYTSQTDLLPPKRELPFAKPAVLTSAHLPSLGPMAHDDDNQNNEEREQTASQGKATRAKSRKPRTKRTVATAPKKAIITRKRAAEAKSKGKIPSVEELLGKSDSAAASTEDATQRGRSDAPANVPLVGETELDQLQHVENLITQPTSKRVGKTQSILSGQAREIMDGRVEVGMEDVVCNSSEGLPVTNERETNRRDVAVGLKEPLRERSRNIYSPQASPRNPVSRAMEALLNEPTFATSPDVSRYAGLPEDERRANLETFMCEQLESPAFHTLCKDMSRMWQRIYFGRENDDA